MRFANYAGHYELNSFPGCNQLVVSNHAFVKKHLRGSGRGKLQHNVRLAKAKELGYDCIICTVRRDNAVEKVILTRNNWTKVHEFYNSETEHTIEVWARNL